MSILVIGFVFAGLAAAIHVYIFVLESVLWTRPATRRIFGVRSAEEAQTMRSLAFNQGFYNLFLAVAIAVGIPLSAARFDAGVTLVLVGTGSMVLAALVLVASRRELRRSAAIQGVLPAIAIVLIVIGMATTPSSASLGESSGFSPLSTSDPQPGLPAGIDPAGVELGDAFVSVVDDDTLAVVTYGSSSCPDVPVGYDASSTSPFRIVTEHTGGEICTADFGPTTTEVVVPSGYAPVTEVALDGKSATVVSR